MDDNGTDDSKRYRDDADFTAKPGTEPQELLPNLDTERESFYYIARALERIADALEAQPKPY